MSSDDAFIDLPFREERGGEWEGGTLVVMLRPTYLVGA